MLIGIIYIYIYIYISISKHTAVITPIIEIAIHPTIIMIQIKFL